MLHIQGANAGKVMKINPYFTWTQKQLSSCNTASIFNTLVTDTFSNLGYNIIANNIMNNYKSICNANGCSYASGTGIANTNTIFLLESMKSNATFIIEDVNLPSRVQCTIYVPNRYAYTQFGIFLYNKTKDALDKPIRIIQLRNNHEVSTTGYNWNNSKGNGSYRDVYESNKSLAHSGFSNPFKYDIDVYNDCPNIMSQHTKYDKYYFGIVDLGNTSGSVTASAVRPVCITSLHIEF